MATSKCHWHSLYNNKKKTLSEQRQIVKSLVEISGCLSIFMEYYVRKLGNPQNIIKKRQLSILHNNTYKVLLFCFT